MIVNSFLSFKFSRLKFFPQQSDHTNVFDGQKTVANAAYNNLKNQKPYLDHKKSSNKSLSSSVEVCRLRNSKFFMHDTRHQNILL
jgi:hypothetical protein